MSTSKGKFWLGVTIGVFTGALAASKLLREKRMPNAKIWQRLLTEKSGEIEAAVRMAQVEKQYEQLHQQRPIFENRVLNSHVEGSILPGLALYRTLLQAGFSSENALAEVDALFKDWFTRFPPAQTRITQLINYLPQNFTFFRSAVHFIMEQYYPSPEWQANLILDGDQALAFNIHRCFYLDILAYYNAPELTASFCKLDDYSMARLPATIHWSRTQTMGMGAEYCDYRWDFLPLDQVHSLSR